MVVLYTPSGQQSLTATSWLLLIFLSFQAVPHTGITAHTFTLHLLLFLFFPFTAIVSSHSISHFPLSHSLYVWQLVYFPSLAFSFLCSSHRSKASKWICLWPSNMKWNARLPQTPWLVCPLAFAGMLETQADIHTHTNTFLYVRHSSQMHLLKQWELKYSSVWCLWIHIVWIM